MPSERQAEQPVAKPAAKPKRACCGSGIVTDPADESEATI